MPFLYKVAVGIIRCLKGLLAGVAIGIAVDRTIKFIDGHQFYDLADSQIGAAVRWLDWVISQSWFWPSFWALAGFVAGTYLDDFVRRYRGAQPVVKNWLDPLDAIEAFTEGELRIERNNMRKTKELLNAQYDDLRIDLRSMGGNSPIGDRLGPMAVPESNELHDLRQRLSDTRTAMATNGESILKKEQDILDDLIQQLKRGRLTGRAFRVRGDQVDELQTVIPDSHWILLKFDTYDLKRQTVGGGGKKYTGLQIGLNENRS